MSKPNVHVSACYRVTVELSYELGDALSADPELNRMWERDVMERSPTRTHQEISNYTNRVETTEFLEREDAWAFAGEMRTLIAEYERNIERK